MLAVIPLPRSNSAHLVKDLPDAADGVATCFMIAAERRTNVAGQPFERAVDLNAAGSLDKPPDIQRPDAAGRYHGDAVVCSVDQPSEEFVVGGVGHHPRDAKVDELLKSLERVGYEVEGSVEDDTAGGEPLKPLNVDFRGGGKDPDGDLAIDPIQIPEHDRQLLLAVAEPAGPRAQHGDKRQAGPLGAGEGSRGRSKAIEFQCGIEFQAVGATAGGGLRIGRGGNGDFEQDARVHDG